MPITRSFCPPADGTLGVWDVGVSQQWKVLVTLTILVVSLAQMIISGLAFVVTLVTPKSGTTIEGAGRSFSHAPIIPPTEVALASRVSI
jgi:hypothetical protein